MSKKPLLIIFLTVFIDLIGFGIIIPLSPYLATQFGADALDVGLLMAVYSGMQFLWSPFWGQLSDRFGRRPIILLSLAGAGLAHLMFAFASSLWVLYVARAFAGIFGANISTAMAYIADVTDEKSRSKGMGLVGAAFGLGFVLGPFVGGVFAQVGEAISSAPPFGKSFAAVVASLICFVNVAMAYKFLPESLKTKNMAKNREPRFKKIFTHLKKPVVGPLMFIFFLCTLAMANMEASLFLYVKDEFQWTITQASFGFAYVGLIMVFTQGYLIRKILPKYGERTILIVGIILFSIGIGAIGISTNVATLAVVVTLLGLGNGLMHPALTGSISLCSGKDEQGGVMGVNQSLSALGRILGPAMGGLLYRDLSHSAPFFAAGALGFLACFFCFSIYANIPSVGKSK